jgi:hypothetical protein
MEVLSAIGVLALAGGCAWLIYVLIDREITRRRELQKLQDTFVQRYGRKGE